jgi:hypothetical protein
VGLHGGPTRCSVSTTSPGWPGPVPPGSSFLARGALCPVYQTRAGFLSCAAAPRYTVCACSGAILEVDGASTACLCRKRPNVGATNSKHSFRGSTLRPAQQMRTTVAALERHRQSTRVRLEAPVSDRVAEHSNKGGAREQQAHVVSFSGHKAVSAEWVAQGGQAPREAQAAAACTLLRKARPIACHLQRPGVCFCALRLLLWAQGEQLGAVHCCSQRSQARRAWDVPCCRGHWCILVPPAAGGALIPFLYKRVKHTRLPTPCAIGAPCQPCSSATQDELVRDISGVLVAVRDAEVQGFAVGWRVADELQARTVPSGPPSGASRVPVKQSSLKPGGPVWSSAHAAPRSAPSQ